MGALMTSSRATLSSLANMALSNVGNDTAVLENPGTMDELHGKIQEVMPENFEDGMLSVTKEIGNHFKITQTVKFRRNLMAPTRFKLGAVCLGSKQISPTEVFPELIGNIDASGNGNATLIHQITSRFRVKTAAQVQQWDLSMGEATIEARGPSNSIDMIVGSLPGIDVITVNYLQCGLALQTSLKVLESVVIGCKVLLPEMGVTFKGMVDTNGDMGIELQQRFMTLPFSFSSPAMRTLERLTYLSTMVRVAYK